MELKLFLVLKLELPIMCELTLPTFLLTLLIHTPIFYSVVVHLGRNCEPLRNIYTIHGYFSILLSNHYNIMMASLCTDLSSTMLGLGQWVEQCNLTMLGFQVLSNGFWLK